MAVKGPWWKRALCYISCEWFTKPIFGKRLCVCVYDILGRKCSVKRELKGKDGGFRFLRVPKVIAFAGLDGSGKSTQAENVIKFLHEIKFKTKYVHLPSSTPLNFAMRAVPSKIKKTKFKKKSKMVSFLRQIAFLVGIPWIYLIKIWPNRFMGRIVIADRWFYDELVHLKYLGMCSLPNFYRKLIPKPSLLYFLNVDAKTAHKRKPEAKIEQFTRKHELYANLNKKIRVNKVKVSNLKNTNKKIIDILKKSMIGLFD
ncbi:hypothetical protein ACFLZ7_00345 [Nanoarchaeota archaeon]